MKALTVGFSKSSKKNAWFSKLIMWAQGTPYSHVYLKHSTGWDDKQLYFQASHTAVNYMSADRFLAEETVIKEFEFQVSDEMYAKMLSFCLEQSAKPYGVVAVIGLAYMLLAQKLGFKAHNPFKDAGETYVCSELIAALLEDLDVQIPMDLDDITPGDLFPIVEKLPADLTSTQKDS